MFIYNNTTRLINLGGKVLLLPGENEITPAQATFIEERVRIKSLLAGPNPMITLSKERIKESEETADDKAKDASEALKNFVENHDGIHDMSDGSLPPADDDLPKPNLSGSIADRIRNGN